VNDSREMVSWALATVGVGPNDMSKDNLAKAKPILAGWMKLIRKYDSDSPKTDLLAGNVDVGVVWSGEAALCWKENHHFAYVLPPKARTCSWTSRDPQRRGQQIRGDRVHELHPSAGSQAS